MHNPEQAAAEKTYRAIGSFIFAFSQVEYTIRHHLGEAIELNEDYFTPVLESYDVAMLCSVAKAVFKRKRSSEIYARIEREINRFMEINNIRTRVAHGLWDPYSDGGTVSHVPRSLKPTVSPNQAEELEKLADELRALERNLGNAIAFFGHSEND
jgi:hypothetical protein